MRQFGINMEEFDFWIFCYSNTTTFMKQGLVEWEFFFIQQGISKGVLS